MITVEQLRAAVRAQAAEDPDRVYVKELGDTCLYEPTVLNSKGCIVGAALTALGVPPERLPGLPGWGTQSVQFKLSPLVEPAATDDRWTMEVQCRQDDGMTWADAVHAADTKYPAAALAA